MGFTKAQNAAINESGKNILVSAAAGSGKTFTLTQRIIKKLIGDENGGADISRMLIVTFTRAAAQELRVKISDALAKAIAENPSNDRLQKQMLLLGSAKICTIDSFFIEPVKNHFEKLDLPASLRIADGAELDDARHEIMNSVIEEMYRENGIGATTKLCNLNTNCDFLDFLSSLSGSRSTSKIIPLILNIHTSLMSSPEGVERLKKTSARLLSMSDADFFESLEGKVIQERATQVTTLAAEKFDYYIGRLDEDEFVKERYLTAFDENMVSCLALANKCKGSYTEVKAAFEGFSAPKLPSMKKDEATPFSEECKKAKTAINKAITDFYKKYLYRTEEELREQIILTAKYNDILYKILSKFDRAYVAYKKEKGLCEFYDMPIYLLRLLEDKRFTVKEEMQAMYDEVYIDEYQDVNEIQDRIFEIIGGNHRFMVGDIKQSIYGFRDAVPELFASYRNEFTKYDEATDESEDCTIFMSENFRCDSTVIDFTNTVCPFLFEASGERLGYTPDDDLKFSKMGLPEDYTPPRVQINMIQKVAANEVSDEIEEEAEDVVTDNIPKEAILCAKEILRLLKHERKPDGTPIQQKDIAVLVRVKNDGPIIAKALKKYNIDYCLSAKSEVFDGEEMKALLDLLRVIDNPEDDISLCGFLTSPAYSGESLLSLEEIVTIRKFTTDSKSLMGALRAYGKLAESGDPLATLLCHRANDIVKLLEKLRALSRKVSVNKLLKALPACEEFSLICQTNAYIFLYDSACNYTKNSWSGLYSFLKYCKKLSEKGSESFSEATPTDAVNIMTIHQSKGLERNTIFVYNTSHKFSTQDTKNALNYNVDLGTATKLPIHVKNEDGEVYTEGYTDSILRDAILLKNRENDVYEEMRVLYVALTRARERLYISATIKNTFEEFKNKIAMSGFSNNAKKNHNNYISWIFASILDPLNNVRRDSFDINVMYEDEICEDFDLPIVLDDSSKSNLTEKELEYVKIISSVNKNAAEAVTSNIPAKIAASKVSPDLFDKILSKPQNMLSEDKTDEQTKAIYARLELMKAAGSSLQSRTKTTPTAADIGTATHAFLQFCDFGLLKNLGIESEITRLVENEFISQEDAALVSKYQINQFVKSNIFPIILSAHKINREFRFGVFVDAASFTQNDSLKANLDSKRVYVQGSIDLLMETESGEIYICDYKTDRLHRDENESHEDFKARLFESHKHQLSQYKDAVFAIFGKNPDKTFIYSLAIGEAVEINI